MFYELTEKELVEKYPILNRGQGDDFILVYLSLDGAATVASHIALLQNNYELEDFLIEFCKEDENWVKPIVLGQMLIRPADEIFNKNVLFAFVKEDFYSLINIDYISKSLLRLKEHYKSYNIKTISIDSLLYKDSIFEPFINDSDFPEIVICKSRLEIDEEIKKDLDKESKSQENETDKPVDSKTKSKTKTKSKN